MDNIITALDHARQLANIVSDWNLDEVEINGEMVGIYALLDEFETAIAALEAPSMERVPSDILKTISAAVESQLSVQIGIDRGSSHRINMLRDAKNWLSQQRPVNAASKQEAKRE